MDKGGRGGDSRMDGRKMREEWQRREEKQKRGISLPG